MVDSQYLCSLESGKKVNVNETWLGVGVSDDLVVLPDEAVQPWRYDPDVVLRWNRTRPNLFPTRASCFDGMRGDAPSLGNGGLRIQRSVPVEKESL